MDAVEYWLVLGTITRQRWPLVEIAQFLICMPHFLTAIMGFHTSIFVEIHGAPFRSQFVH